MSEVHTQTERDALEAQTDADKIVAEAIRRIEAGMPCSDSEYCFDAGGLEIWTARGEDGVAAYSYSSRSGVALASPSRELRKRFWQAYDAWLTRAHDAQIAAVAASLHPKPPEAPAYEPNLSELIWGAIQKLFPKSANPNHNKSPQSDGGKG